MLAVTKQARQKFFTRLDSINNVILIHSENYSINNDSELRKAAKSCNIVLQMTLKRLVHKMFVGERKKNVRTEFNGHLYTAQLNETSNLDFFKQCAHKQIKVCGAIYNKKLYREYRPYMDSLFNKNKFMILCLFKVIQSMLVVINQVKIK